MCRLNDLQFTQPRAREPRALTTNPPACLLRCIAAANFWAYDSTRRISITVRITRRPDFRAGAPGEQLSGTQPPRPPAIADKGALSVLHFYSGWVIAVWARHGNLKAFPSTLFRARHRMVGAMLSPSMAHVNSIQGIQIPPIVLRKVACSLIPRNDWIASRRRERTPPTPPRTANSARA